MLFAATLAAEVTLEPIPIVEVQPVTDPKTVEQLLQELQTALATSKMFPDAVPTEHVSFDFDMTTGTITARTDGVDETGQPVEVIFSKPVAAEPEMKVVAEETLTSEA
jgi:hypothetical protein